MAPHYAISEAFIVFAALWCGWKMFKNHQGMAAIGVLFFGAAAAVGVYRFSTGHIETLAGFHRLAGQLGGLLGLALIASEFVKSSVPRPAQKPSVSAALILTVLSFILAWNNPALAVPLFLLWSLLAIIAAFFISKSSVFKRLLYSLGTSGMVLNVIFIRQSSLMSHAVSWHVFHILVAVWLMLIFFILNREVSVNAHPID